MMLQAQLPLLAEDNSAAAPLASELCSQCGNAPRAANGRLSRCLGCIREAAEEARNCRKAAEARATKPLRAATDATLKTDIEKLRTAETGKATKPAARSKKQSAKAIDPNAAPASAKARKAAKTKPHQAEPAETAAKPAEPVTLLTDANTRRARERWCGEGLPLLQRGEADGGIRAPSSVKGQSSQHARAPCHRAAVARVLVHAWRH